MLRHRFRFSTSLAAGLSAFLFAGSSTHVIGTAPQAATAGVARTDASARGGAGQFRSSLDVSVFQRGNLHAHSSRSDGDASPEDVYRWY